MSNKIQVTLELSLLFLIDTFGQVAERLVVSVVEQSRSIVAERN